MSGGLPSKPQTYLWNSCVLKMGGRTAHFDKRGTMNRTKVLLGVVIFLVLLSFFAFADTDLGTACSSPSDCNFCTAYGWACYCSQASKTCQISGDTSVPANTNQTPNQTSAASQTLPQNSTSTSAAVAPISVVDQQQFSALEKEVAILKPRIENLENTFRGLQGKINEISIEIAQQRSSLQSLSSEQRELENQLNLELKSVSTGLAGLQENVAETQAEVASLEEAVTQRQALVRTFIYVLLIIAVFAGIAGFILYQKKSGKTFEQEVLDYITQHIKAGRKFLHIKDELLKAGWPEEEIQKAYKETVRRNYQKYAQKQPSSHIKKVSVESKLTASYDKNKILGIALVSVLLVIGIFFLLRETTGQAIHFESERDLDFAVKDLLDRLIDENDFYPLLESFELCVEVHDLEKSVSYVVEKAGDESTVEKAGVACSATIQHDFSLKFLEWNAFNINLRKPSCENFARQHKDKKMYVLPSKLVLPGFKMNPFESYDRFCPLLLKCLNKEDLAKAGLSC